MIPAIPTSSGNMAVASFDESHSSRKNTDTAPTSAHPHPHAHAHMNLNMNMSNAHDNDNFKRDYGEMVSHISEDEEDTEKRRRGRNQREQERSQQISKQISGLKKVLTQASVPFKPDKFSTLVSVHDYIKTLQERTALLDEEQRKLVETITRADEIVNKSQHGHQVVQSNANAASNNNSASAPEPLPQHSANGHAVIPSRNSNSNRSLKNPDEDEILVFVRGLDYKSVFSKVRISLCVTSIDGQLLDCNDEFVRVCSLERGVLVAAGLRKPDEENCEEMAGAGKQPMSLFTLMAREDMQKVFEAMSGMLKTAAEANEIDNDASASASRTGMGGMLSGDGGIIQRRPARIKSDHWGCEIRHCNNSTVKIQLNISLVRQKEGTPRFFNCALNTVATST